MRYLIFTLIFFFTFNIHTQENEGTHQDSTDYEANIENLTIRELYTRTCLRNWLRHECIAATQINPKEFSVCTQKITDSYAHGVIEYVKKCREAKLNQLYQEILKVISEYKNPNIKR